MSEVKTKVTNATVMDFINSVEDEVKRKDSHRLLELFQEITREEPKMWGTSIIGYGVYHYKSDRSKQEGDWPLTGFSPRKQALTLYVMLGFGGYDTLLEKLGKYKKSKGCLYIKRLSDVDETVLKKIIEKSYEEVKKRYKTPPAS